MDRIIDSVTLFHGRKDGFEDPSEYLESIGLAVDSQYDDPVKAAAIKRNGLQNTPP